MSRRRSEGTIVARQGVSFGRVRYMTSPGLSRAVVEPIYARLATKLREVDEVTFHPLPPHRVPVDGK